MAFRDGWFYIANTDGVVRVKLGADGKATGTPEKVNEYSTDGRPLDAEHPVRRRWRDVRRDRLDVQHLRGAVARSRRGHAVRRRREERTPLLEWPAQRGRHGAEPDARGRSG